MPGAQSVHNVLAPLGPIPTPGLRVALWLSSGGLALSACTTPTSARTPVEAPAADPIALRVEALAAQARQEEPRVTPMLVRLAEAAGGEMIKLKYRLKTEASATRKLNKHLLKHPGEEAAQVDLQDMLRYTMRIEDQPAGNYVKSVHHILETLEAAGHTV